jgi:hypothetical protein
MQRDSIIDLIEKRYFGNVMRADLPAIRACFTPDCEVLIRHGDGPARRFVGEAVVNAREASPLMDFYTHICGEYACWFGDFTHTIDTETQRAASLFTVRLTPLAGRKYEGWPVQELTNANFFWFRGERIARMIIYYSNPHPTAPDGVRNPTGYPAEA